MSSDDNTSLLVPVDFSRNSREAVQLALFLGKKMGGRIKLMHVILDVTREDDGKNTKEKTKKKVKQYLEAVAKSLMDDFIQKNELGKIAKSSGLTLETAFETGDPLEAIIAEADKGKHGMIVMGASGKTGVSKLLLGSVAERVIQLATIPVVIAKKSGKKE